MTGPCPIDAVYNKESGSCSFVSMKTDPVTKEEVVIHYKFILLSLNQTICAKAQGVCAAKSIHGLPYSMSRRKNFHEYEMDNLLRPLNSDQIKADIGNLLWNPMGSHEFADDGTFVSLTADEVISQQSCTLSKCSIGNGNPITDNHPQKDGFGAICWGTVLMIVHILHFNFVLFRLQKLHNKYIFQ